ncbi:MAG: phage portal protein [Anaerolineae bacterium]|nr:phage portal protein [Anaerolineae bacterium]
MSFILPTDDAGFALKSAIQRWVASERAAPTSQNLVDLYATAVTVYAVANFRAENVAQVALRIVGPDDAALPTADPRARLFQRRFYDAMLRTELALFFWGTNLLVKQRNFYGQWVGLRWLNPHLWRADLAPSGLRGFHVLNAATGFAPVAERYIEPADAVYMHEVDFDNDFDGVSPAEVAFSFAGVEEEAAQTMLHFFRNRAIPALLLQPAAEAGGEQVPDIGARDRLVRFFRRMVQGARNAGRTIIDYKRWEAVLLQGTSTRRRRRRARTRRARRCRWRRACRSRCCWRTRRTTRRRTTSGWGGRRTGSCRGCNATAAYFSDAVEAELGVGWRVEPDFADLLGSWRRGARRRCARRWRARC